MVMHNKIKAALATLAIVGGGIAFVLACIWYPMFMFNAICIGLTGGMVFGLYKSLVAHYDAKDKNKK